MLKRTKCKDYSSTVAEQVVLYFLNLVNRVSNQFTDASFAELEMYAVCSRGNALLPAVTSRIYIYQICALTMAGWNSEKLSKSVNKS